MAEKNIKNRTGLILGKFYPPHNGHRYLIDQASVRCSTLYILVCSLKSEIIPGILRYRWLKEMYPEHTIIHVTDENPSFPEEHTDFWKIWKETILKSVPARPHVLFTSETYGNRLAQELDCAHEMIDESRTVIPISGTAIRQEPLSYWEYIPQVVQRHLIKKIVLTGPESCGKSTLALQLAKYFKTVFAPEYARQYLDSMGRYVLEQDILEIMKGHIEQENMLSAIANKILFLDTDLTVTRVYSQHYFNFVPHELAREEKVKIYDHYLLLKPDIPWVADWQRDAPHLREEFFSRFEMEIIRKGAPYTIISGNFESRFKSAVETTRKVMTYPMRISEHNVL